MPADVSPNQIKFEIKKIYLKDVSFESPQSPRIFARQDINPKMDVRIRILHSRIETGDHFEVVLSVTVTANLGEKTMFLVEIQQAGIFEISGVPENELTAVLEVACPSVLLPFARQAISDLTSKGGFPALLISPVNFERLYQSKLNQEATETNVRAGDTTEATA